MKSCPLCSLKLDEEKVWYADKNIIIMETKEERNSRPRIICFYREHVKHISKKESDHAAEKLKGVAMRVFAYTDMFEIKPGTYKQIRDHWHILASEADHDGGKHGSAAYASKTGRKRAGNPEN